MNHEILSSLEIDAIGEIVNISLGSSATAVSNLLEARVDITVPRVRVVSYDEFEFKNLEPAFAVIIDYVTGITGNNIMILKKQDIKVIVEMLMHTEIDDNFEMDEIYLSAICEVMNQMMGASSTALSELMGKMINISPPSTFEVKETSDFKAKHFEKSDHFVVIEFDLSIEGKLKSEFMNVMPMELVKEMVSTFMKDMHASEPVTQAVLAEPEPAPASSGGTLTQEQIEAMMAGNVEPEPAPASSGGTLTQAQIEAMMAGNAEPEPTPAPAPSGGTLTQAQIEAMMVGNAQPEPTPIKIQPAMEHPPTIQAAPSNVNHSVPPRVVEVKETQNDKSHLTGVPKQENVDMLMDVPLVVSVEIGRTKKPIKEILEITQGSLIVLDKMAGDQVEVYANNRCIARGDVVVVHDNFGIRVTEVMGKS